MTCTFTLSATARRAARTQLRLPAAGASDKRHVTTRRVQPHRVNVNALSRFTAESSSGPASREGSGNGEPARGEAVQRASPGEAVQRAGQGATNARPFAYRSIDAGLRAFDLKILVEASNSLGAGWPSTLWRVVLPNLTTALLSATVLTVALGKLYAEPATAFVAKFAGTMNRIPGELDGDGRVRLLGATLPVKGERPVGQDKVDALVRPESLRMTAVPDGNGIVTIATFLGSLTRVSVLLPGDVTVQVDQPSAEAAAMLPVRQSR
jgi:hypothetical protein